MRAQLDNNNNVIAFGEWGDDQTFTYLTLPSNWRPAAQTVYHWNGTTLVGIRIPDAPPPVPVTTAGPDIPAMITALMKSPAIDQPTKSALIAALQGE